MWKITGRWILAVCSLMVCCAGVALGQERYREPYRPQFHFTPERNWMNDPNGMVYFDGEWHLFYQYNPHGDRWGHMSWGHAVSRDLVHWEHLSLALAEEDGIMIFSGSAVVDWKNTTGFGSQDKPPLVAIYTGHRDGRQDQRLAFSNDRGRTWTKFTGNPVLDLKMADFRDPKVFWHEATSRWVMTVALATEKKVHFYTSPDLKQWKYVGEFGPAGSVDGLWECPDLFPLPVEGGGARWVLIVNINPGGPAGGSGCQYFVGDFDGTKFTPDPLPAALAEFVPEGKLLADFEKGYADWKVEDEAFGTEPARGTLPRQQPVTGFKGQGLANSFRDGDRTQGTLTSPSFEITAKHINFLIGGGAHETTRVDLIIDGKAVRSARGRERERLTWHSWDVSEFRGRTAQIQAVDRHSGGWGHINLDHLMLADQPARSAHENPLWADRGADFYAAVSWSDVPTADGRRVWLGWMSNWNYANDVPTSPWRSTMSVPRTLSLRKVPVQATGQAETYVLVQQPVKELQQLVQKSWALNTSKAAWPPSAVTTEGQLTDMTFRLDVTLKPGQARSCGLRIRTGPDEYTEVGYDRQHSAVYVDRRKSGLSNFHPTFSARHEAPARLINGEVALQLFVDRSSIETFINNGEAVITDCIFPTKSQPVIEAFTGDNTAVVKATLHSLKSAWQK